MQKLCFDRLLALSMRWHAGKNTGATLSLLDQGSAITELFQVRLSSLPLSPAHLALEADP